MRRLRRAALLPLLLLSSACSWTGDPPGKGDLLRVRPFVPATPGELGTTFWQNRANRVEVLADRHEYFADELHGQFLVCFLGQIKDEEAAQRVIELELRRPDGSVLTGTKVTPVLSPKLPVLVRTFDLAPATGSYELRAKLTDLEGQVLVEASRSFVRSKRTDPRPAFPAAGVAIRVHEQSHVPDAAWPISTGVPMPKMTLLKPEGLVLLENGKPVPAQLSTRATWSPEGYVKWLGVDFIARYDRGQPRQYRLVHRDAAAPTPDTPLKVEQTDTHITIDTGAARFVIGRKPFTGIEAASVRDASGERQVIAGVGGSYVVDQDGVHYSSAHDQDAQVTVEESGPLMVSLAARGWCTSEDGRKLCMYVVRIRGYAGQKSLSVSHRIVNTIADRWEETRLSNVGFALQPAGRASGWSAGIDGQLVRQDLTPLQASLFVHQERGDRARVVADERETHVGRRSDGSVYLHTPADGLGVHLRDMAQKFPHEIEYEPAVGRLLLHFWPRHGRVVFTEEEELARDQIYKVRWAHQGRLLDMPIPDKYHRVLVKLDEEENWTAGGGELVIVDHAKNITKVQAASGQGTVLGDEFTVTLEAPAEGQLAQAALIQQQPHALADPAWSCATFALGHVARRDPRKFGPAERLMDGAYNFYRHAIIEAGEEYGRWIYGGVHSSWEPALNAANMKRVWQMSHYQNVFQAWLLYFRSGLEDHYQWARMHTSQHLDVGVNNYRAYPPGTHSYSRFGEMGGDIYHCKGFMPWAGNSSTSGHWIDLTCYFMPWYLTGDRRGLDMAQTWMNTVGKLGSSNKRTWPSRREDYQSPEVAQRIAEFLKEHPEMKKEDYPPWILDEQAKPQPFNPREVFVPLGEVTQLYQATWDPQVLITLDQYAEHLNPEFEHTNSPSLATFGKHWQDWYYHLTRDRRVIDRIRHFMDSDWHTRQPPRYESFAAFLFHVTGEDRYLRHVVADVHDSTLNIYDAPGERYHGYCLAHSNPAAMLLGRLPYVLEALDRAGLKFEHAQDEPTTIPTRGGRVDMADKHPVPPRGWSNTGVTIIALNQANSRVAVSIDGPMGYGGFRGLYALYQGLIPLNSLPLGRDLRPFYEQTQRDLVPFRATNGFNDPPEFRNFVSGAPSIRQVFPYVEQADNDPANPLYRLELGGAAIDLPALLDAATHQPLPQVAVIPRTQHWNAQVRDSSFRVLGAVKAYMRPLDDHAAVTLSVQSVHVRYSMPTTLRITDATGKTVIDTSLFMHGRRGEAEVTLDPAVHRLPWLFESASSGDNRFSFTGVEELFFARSPADFDAILPKIPLAPVEPPAESAPGG